MEKSVVNCNLKDIVNVYIFDTNDYTYFDLLKLYSFDEVELKEMETMLNEVKKKEKLISLYLKKHFIGECFVSESKKPHADHIKFNISHSNGIVVLATSTEKELGVDIEKIRDINLNILNKITSDKEKEIIKTNKDFLSIWTQKEAVLKCLGEGIINNLNEVPTSIPEGILSYKNLKIVAKTHYFSDFVLSIALLNDKDFDIKIIKL